MQVFKTYFIILKKCKINVLLYCGVFMAIALIMSAIQTSEGESGFLAESLEIGLVDLDGGTLGGAIKDYFSQENHIIEVENDIDAITNDLYWRELDYVLLIPEGYEEGLISGDETVEFSCMKVPGYFESAYFEAEFSLYMEKLTGLVRAGYTVEEAALELKALCEEQVDVEIADFVNEDQHDILVNFFLYVPYLFIAAGIVGIGLVLLRLQEQDIKDRTECSPMPLWNRNLGMAAGVLAYGLMLYLAVFLVAGILSAGSIFTDARLPWFALNIGGMLLFGSSLGFCTGMLAKSMDAVNGIVNVLSLALCFLGGIFVPRELFSEGVKRLAEFMPTYWYVVSNEQIGGMKELNSAFVEDILVRTGMFAACALVIFALTLVYVSAKRKRV